MNIFITTKFNLELVVIADNWRILQNGTDCIEFYQLKTLVFTMKNTDIKKAGYWVHVGPEGREWREF